MPDGRRGPRFHALPRIGERQQMLAACFARSGLRLVPTASALGCSVTMLRMELRGARLMPEARQVALAALLQL